MQSDARIAPLSATIRLTSLTSQARNALQVDTLEIPTFPFRLGRESRNGQRLFADMSDRRVRIVPPTNDIFLFDLGVPLQISREHCQIERNEKGQFSVWDRMSACGTGVVHEGKLHYCHTSRFPILDGDTLIIGNSDSPYRFLCSILQRSY